MIIEWIHPKPETTARTTLADFGVELPSVHYVRGHTGKYGEKRSWLRVFVNPKTGESDMHFCCIESDNHNHHGFPPPLR